MKKRFAMVGGSVDSFIGPVHRIAATLDGAAELVAGSFSRDAEKNRRTAAAWYLDAARVYPDYRALIAAEAGRIDYLVICTPNNSHVAIATAALEAGIPVVSDKPLGISVEECVGLERLVRERQLPFMVTYNYSGYPMVREARAMRLAGQLGTLQRIHVEMPQGWVRALIALSGSEPKIWRADPAISGPSFATGDVGTHALHLAEFVTGLRVIALKADTTTLLSGSSLDNDANILVQFEQDVSGFITVSEFATGERNPLRLRAYGTKLGIEWVQETPEQLLVKQPDGNQRILFRGHSPEAESTRWSRIPIGHPEGFLEAFANIYAEFHRAIDEWRTGAPLADGIGRFSYPGVADGVRGVRFIEAVVASGASGSRAGWTPM